MVCTSWQWSNLNWYDRVTFHTVSRVCRQHSNPATIALKIPMSLIWFYRTRAHCYPTAHRFKILPHKFILVPHGSNCHPSFNAVIQVQNQPVKARTVTTVWHRTSMRFHPHKFPLPSQQNNKFWNWQTPNTSLKVYFMFSPLKKPACCNNYSSHKIVCLLFSLQEN